MKLWLIERPSKDVDWDQTAGYVIRAESEAVARAMAAENAGAWDEGPGAWLSEPGSTCIELLPEGEAGVVLRDFNAG